MDYKIEYLEEVFRELYGKCEKNVVSAEAALPGCAGLTLFEVPLVGVADAADPLFETFRDPDVIGPPYMGPQEWLPGTKSIIAFFFPMTERVRSSNRGDPENTSSEWLHARYEGQAFQNEFTDYVEAWFREQGFEACVPATDPRFETLRDDRDPGSPEGVHYSSAWSERHAAYAAGLGTFCLSRGLITEKGVTGRFSSVLVTAEIAPTPRSYTGIYDNCIRCGACMRNCPANAITLEHGKSQRLCSAWVHDRTKKLYAPRHGCGKCQVAVPCEFRNPARRRG